MGERRVTCRRCGRTQAEAIPPEIAAYEQFHDIDRNAWSYDGIQYCVARGLMSGTDTHTFLPGGVTTRAQLVQVLYHLAGDPDMTGVTTPFTDLTSDWYQAAVAWAYETGVVDGTSPTTFSPSRPVTREQAAVLLMRYAARLPGFAGSAVLDADALNALAAGKYRGNLPANTILTPHPGEAARLLGLTVPEVQADREGAAVSLAEKYHCVAVLKGHHTLVAAPDGTVWRNETGNAGLAKGGSGDILAGLTAGLLAASLKQGRTPEDAAVCAVWLHGAAADRCAKRRSMTAMLPGDLFEDLGWILGELGR